MTPSIGPSSWNKTLRGGQWNNRYLPLIGRLSAVNFYRDNSQLFFNETLPERDPFRADSAAQNRIDFSDLAPEISVAGPFEISFLSYKPPSDDLDELDVEGITLSDFRPAYGPELIRMMRLYHGVRLVRRLNGEEKNRISSVERKDD